MIYGTTKYTAHHKDGSKTIEYHWDWEQFVFDLKAHWHSWYLRTIGLPLLERRLKRIARSGTQIIEHAEKYMPKSKWTPSPELIAIIQNMDTGHDHESLLDRRY